MGEVESIVFIIDDDPLYRKSSERLVRSVGFSVQSFESARDFLGSRRPNMPSCLVLDVRMPGLSGLDLQRELAGAGIDIPIIFVTGHGDIPMTVQAMKAGAVEFLTKPFRDEALLDAIRQAIGRDRVARQQHARNADLRRRYQSLNPREREVFKCVVAGMLNKQIADELGITERTVKFHRGHIMRKMQVQSLAELVRMAEALGIARQAT
ncbi:MAG TPA: response regulator transcription factor [Chthoniobacterales bacterium]|nr:response regulator transcription factor [Chthoniobacterales bacterium]